MASRAPTRCYRCDAGGLVNYSITVDGAQQKLTVRGKKRTHAHARCSNNHEWWSVNHDIMAASRKADAQGQPVVLSHAR